MLKQVLLVALGGAFGSVCRFLVGLGALRAFGQIQFGTLAVNVVGSFLIAVLAQTVPAATNEDLRIFAAVGVLGGFTTYSSMNNETLALAQSGALGLAGAYLVGTVLSCLLAGVLGTLAGRALAAG